MNDALSEKSQVVFVFVENRPQYPADPCAKRRLEGWEVEVSVLASLDALEETDE